MIQGASDCPIANDGTLQRLLVGGLVSGPAPAVGRPASRFHMQGMHPHWLWRTPTVQIDVELN